MSLQSISITGEGCISGGKYAKVRVMGEGKIIGDVEAEILSIMGELTSESNIKVNRLSISGEGKFMAVDAQEIKIMGSAKFKGNVNTKSIKISGSAELDANIKSNGISIWGYMEAKGAESEKFVSRGAFELDDLNANDIDIRLGGSCKVNEIGGESVTVHYSRCKKILLDVLDIILFRKIKRAQLRVDTIEADSIYLQNTVAKSVKGNNIIIGSGCRIQNIEYKDTVYIDHSSVVEKYTKI